MAEIWEKAAEMVRQVVEKKGKVWLIAALVEDSLGYYTPSTACNMVEMLMKGLPYGSERTAFMGGPLREIESAVRWFEYLEKECPEKSRKIIELVEAVMKMSDERQATFGLMYPTLVIAP